MKIICAGGKLKEALDYTERIIARNLTLPILNNLLIKTERNGLKVVSTNLEIGVTCWFGCKVLKEGELTVPAKIFYGIVSNLNSDKINLEVKKENTLNINAGEYRADLKGQSAKDFPIIPKLKPDIVLEINIGEFSRALGQVINFVSNSETRPEITGILFAKEKNQTSLRLVSTDSFRLGEKTISVKNEFKEIEFSIIIPQKTAAEVLRVFSGKEGELKIIIEKNQVGFELDKIEIISRLIEGNYPDYKPLIPHEFKTEAIVDKDELLKTIKLISLFSSRINDIRFLISPGKDSKIKAFASDPDLGENSSSINASVSGQALEISFNWRYLADGLAVISDAGVALGFVDETKPCLVRSTQDKNFLYLVMPIRA